MKEHKEIEILEAILAILIKHQYSEKKVVARVIVDYFLEEKDLIKFKDEQI